MRLVVKYNEGVLRHPVKRQDYSGMFWRIWPAGTEWAGARYIGNAQILLSEGVRYTMRHHGYHILYGAKGYCPLPSRLERDPFVAFVKSIGAGPRIVERHAEGETVTVRTMERDLWRAYSHGTTDYLLDTDGKVSRQEISRYRVPNQYANDEVEEICTVEEATYAALIRKRVHMNSSIGRYLDLLHIWPGADLEKVKKEILEWNLSHSIPLWEHDPWPDEGAGACSMK